MKKFKEIIIPNDGYKKWSEGAYCFTFVYSNRGNFLLKGYLRETDKYLIDLKTKEYKYYYIQSLFSHGTHRTIIRHYKNGVNIWSPMYPYTEKNKLFNWDMGKYALINYGNIKQFKRLPNRWVKELDI